MLVLAPVVPALAIIAVAGWRLREAARADARARVVEVALEVGATTARVIAGGRALLDSVARLPAVTRGDDATCSAALAALQRGHPEVNVLSRTRATGLLTCSAIPGRPPVDVRDLPSFQRPLRTGRFALGDFQVSRLTGKPVLVLAQPWYDADGTLRYMLAASLKLEVLRDALRRARPSPGAELVLVDSVGTVLAAATGEDAATDDTTRARALARQAVAWRARMDGGAVHDVPGADGRTALLAVRRLAVGEETAVWLALRMPTRVAYAAADGALLRDVLLLLLGGVLSAGLAWHFAERRLVGSMTPLVTTARRLAGGDTTARVGDACHVAEFAELGATVDAMIDALLERQAQYSALADRSPDAIVRATPLGELLYENDAAQRLRDAAATAGLPAPRVLGAPWIALVEAVASAGEATSLEVTFALRDGTRVLDLRAVPERDAAGALASVLIVGRDVTTQRRADEEAAQAQRLESISRVAEALSANVSRVVEGASLHAEVLALLVEPAHAAHAEVEALRDTLADGRALLRELRDTGTEAPLLTATVCLVDAVAEARASLEPQGVALAVAPRASRVEARIDQAQFTLLLRTLLAPPAGEGDTVRHVTARTGTGAVPLDVRRRFQLHDGEYASLALHDAGRVIPAVLLPRLFEPFVGGGGGAGTAGRFGLASCLGIVRRHGGAIAVQSDAAHGTTFTVWFPLAREGVAVG